MTTSRDALKMFLFAIWLAAIGMWCSGCESPSEIEPVQPPLPVPKPVPSLELQVPKPVPDIVTQATPVDMTETLDAQWANIMRTIAEDVANPAVDAPQPEPEGEWARIIREEIAWMRARSRR